MRDHQDSIPVSNRGLSIAIIGCTYIIDLYISMHVHVYIHRAIDMCSLISTLVKRANDGTIVAQIIA